MFVNLKFELITFGLEHIVVENIPYTVNHGISQVLIPDIWLLYSYI